jgi:hypothetical protein
MRNKILEYYKKLFQNWSLTMALSLSVVSIFIMIIYFGKELSFDERRQWTPVLIGVSASGFGVVIAYIMIVIMHLRRIRRTMFISYTHQDIEFVQKLAKDLEEVNIEPLIDRLELKVGDNIRQVVDEMIDRSEYFLFVISTNSMKSDWAKKELEQAMERKKKILPALLHSAEVPPELSGVFYADFTGKYETGLEQLKKTLSTK